MGINNWDSSDSERSESPAISLESLPIRKRYMRTHLEVKEMDNSPPQYQSSSPGYQSNSGYHQSVPSDGYQAASAGYQSSSSSSSSSSKSANNSERTYPVRAGVIRHTDNPRMCLAYYYLPK